MCGSKLGFALGLSAIVVAMALASGIFGPTPEQVIEPDPAPPEPQLKSVLVEAPNDSE